MFCFGFGLRGAHMAGDLCDEYPITGLRDLGSKALTRSRRGDKDKSSQPRTASHSDSRTSRSTLSTPTGQSNPPHNPRRPPHRPDNKRSIHPLYTPPLRHLQQQTPDILAEVPAQRIKHHRWRSSRIQDRSSQTNRNLQTVPVLSTHFPQHSRKSGRGARQRPHETQR